MKPKKLKFLIVSGPTREPIDPVRYISNYSTGVMGKELVSAATERGHRVEWVECPRRVETALELKALLVKLTPRSDVLVMAAAVADARPARYSAAKIKKDRLQAIRLVKNPDILKHLSLGKKKRQIFVGFGLESGKIVANGTKKLRSKSLDLILLQRVTKKSNPFGHQNIDATLLGVGGIIGNFKAAQKAKIAMDLIRRAEAMHALKSRD